MKKSGYIFIALYVAAAAAVLYFAFPVMKKRYFSSDKLLQSKESSVQNVSDSSSGGNQNSDQNQAPSENTTSVGENSAPEGTHLFVSRDECDSDCKKFKAIEEDFKYCQEVCGIIPSETKNSEGDCANSTGLEKDYCFRDLAVSKKDFGICLKINDKKLQTVCHSRVAEEILN